MGLLTAASRIGIFCCGYYTFTHQVLDFWLISAGESMEPTLSVGNIVLALPARSVFWDLSLVDSLTLQLTDRTSGLATIQRGDLVVARNPTQPTQHIIKRVLGLEGDRIPLSLRLHHRFVPAGQAWIEGDNATNSRDSRSFGPVPLGLVQARVVARLWPLQLL